MSKQEEIFKCLNDRLHRQMYDRLFITLYFRLRHQLGYPYKDRTNRWVLHLDYRLHDQLHYRLHDQLYYRLQARLEECK
jgi:hypothetical protein